jgi:Asp/Glu/hydantoin racemase
MAGYAAEVQRELGVVVLDPSAVALKLCEALIDAGLRHSKRALFARPPAKQIRK